MNTSIATGPKKFLFAAPLEKQGDPVWEKFKQLNQVIKASKRLGRSELLSQRGALEFAKILARQSFSPGSSAYQIAVQYLVSELRSKERKITRQEESVLSGVLSSSMFALPDATFEVPLNKVAISSNLRARAINAFKALSSCELQALCIDSEFAKETSSLRETVADALASGSCQNSVIPVLRSAVGMHERSIRKTTPPVQAATEPKKITLAGVLVAKLNEFVLTRWFRKPAV